jgi:LacI family transcriptional regulator
MRDVAQRAGVSVTTVSHVINGTRFVSPELQGRVLEAMKALRFRPNMLARSLRLKETRIIGLLVPDNVNPFFAQVSRVVEDAGFEAGYSVILCNCDGKLEKELAYVDLLSAKQVDGIIFIATGGDKQIVDLLREIGIPFVMADRQVESADVDIVLVDNFQGGYQATRHLLALGHRRIGCITGPHEATPSADRVRGYRAALAESGFDEEEDLIVTGDFRHDGGELAMLQLLDLAEPPTAVFACNDLMAIGALSALWSRGLRVPENISLIGFDDIPEARLTIPPLTTVAQPIAEIGKRATEMLIERASSQAPISRRQVTLAVRLVERGSCAVRPS